MKKIISLVLASILSLALLTGCTDSSSGSQSDIKPTPTPSSSPVSDRINNEEKEENDYETVVALWRDMNGYWARHDGGYLHFTYDEDGTAVAYSYDRFDALISVFYPKSVMASNKTTYVMEVEYPAIENNEKYPDFKQGAAKATFTMEIAGFGDGFVELIDEDGNTMPYASVGKSLEYLIDGVEQAKELMK